MTLLPAAHPFFMKDLDIHPATPQQRKQGWEESLTWFDQHWPTAWEIRPTVDVFVLGAQYAEVCPIYWDDGQTRGVDWWVLSQKNTTSMGMSINTEPERWERVESPQDVFAMFEDWQWDAECRHHARVQLESMMTTQKLWTQLPAQSLLAIVPTARLWDQWGMDNYTPSALEGADAAVYQGVARVPVQRPKIKV